MSAGENRRDLFRLTAVNGAALSVRIVSALAVNKVMAAALGSAGFAIFAQAQNVLGLLISFATNGLSAGVTKLTAERRDQRSIGSVWGMSVLASVVIGLAASMVLLIFAQPLASLLFQDPAAASYIRIVAAATPFGCCAPLPLAALNGQRESISCALAPMIANILGAAATAVLCLTLDLRGAVLSIVFAQVISLIVNGYFFLRRNSARRIAPLLSLDGQPLRSLLGFTAMALIGGAATQAASLYVRTNITSLYGWHQAGEWQAVVKISEIYLSLATSTLTIYYLPRLSQAESLTDFKKLLFPAMSWILPAVLVGCLSVFALRHLIVQVAFTPEFYPIADIIWAQLIADFLRIASYLFAMVMWAKKMTRTFVIMEVTFAALFAVVSVQLAARLGIIGVLYGQVITYMLYTLASMAVAFRLAPWKTGREFT
jgi:PST family polysaccharide transporter